MAKRINVSYESLRQEGREEVLEWLQQREIVHYSTMEQKYFILSQDSGWLVFTPWTKLS
jgi:hypothetical protein